MPRNCVCLMMDLRKQKKDAKNEIDLKINGGRQKRGYQRHPKSFTSLKLEDNFNFALLEKHSFFHFSKGGLHYLNVFLLKRTYSPS